MNDIDQTLRADAERWRSGLRPAPDLDDQLSRALARPKHSRLLLPLLAAAVVAAVAVSVTAIAWPAGHHHHHPPAGPSLAQITGVTWKDPASTGTVVYTTTTMRLFDGCTNELAHLTVRHGTLMQGQPIEPISVCASAAIPPGPDGDAARAEQKRLAHFWAVVAGPATWSRHGDTLTLTTPGQGTVRLTTAATPAPMLAGTTWTLTEYNGTDAYTHDAAAPLRLSVAPSGSFTADLTCGSLTGTAQVSAAAVRFTDVTTTGCAGGLDATSAAVAAVIKSGRVTYAIRGTQLFVYEPDGRTLMYQS